MEKSYRNLGYVLLILIPLTLIAFWVTYFSQFPDFNENINAYHHIHAFIATIWILMLIVQPILIARGNRTLHKTFGKASYVVFPLLILSFVPQMIRMLQSDYSIYFFFPMADSILLITFYSLAIIHRKNTALHMRYMIGTAIVFLAPTLGRIGPILLGLDPVVSQTILYLVVYVILVLLITSDRRNKRQFQPYVYMLMLWMVHHMAFYMIF